MKQPMGKALWSDCETDEERAVFFRSGRAWLAGKITLAMIFPIADAFEDAAKWRRHEQTINQAIDAAVAAGDYTVFDTPPWGPDAVPLMACPAAGTDLFCEHCRHRKYGHEDFGGCGPSACPACVQVGWRERSKP
jgi:hypothetical protein